MNVSIFSTMDYENLSDWTIGQNKPNSKPIKANLESTLKSNAILDDIKYGKFGRCCKSLIYKIILFRAC